MLELDTRIRYLVKENKDLQLSNEEILKQSFEKQQFSKDEIENLKIQVQRLENKCASFERNNGATSFSKIKPEESSTARDQVIFQIFQIFFSSEYCQHNFKK